MKAIRVEKQGGPEVMVYQDFELPPPGPGQVQVKLEAIGVNFRDLYQRSGEYPMKLPYTPGTEGAGTVVAVGQEVSGFGVGDRVGYYGALGAYAEVSNVPARRVIKFPDDCSFERAAAVMGQGTTAHYLVHSCYPLEIGRRDVPGACGCRGPGAADGADGETDRGEGYRHHFDGGEGRGG